MTSKQQLVPVTERAITQRINRKLAESGTQLKKNRSGRAADEIGEFFILDLSRNCVVHKFVDVGKLAAELGVLQPWERLTNQ